MVSVDFDQVCLIKDISMKTYGLDRPPMFPQTPLGPVCSLHCIPSHDLKSIDFRVFLPCILLCINLANVVPQISLRQQLQHHCVTMLDMLGLECLQLLHPPPVVVDIFFHVVTSEFQIDNAFIAFPIVHLQSRPGFSQYKDLFFECSTIYGVLGGGEIDEVEQGCAMEGMTFCSLLVVEELGAGCVGLCFETVGRG